MNEESTAWDQEYDVVVVGSGAGGLATALSCAQLGLSVLTIEKSEVYGGTSAVSGGGIWIPCNDQIESVGGNDTREEALTYLKHLTRGEVPDSKLETYVDSARQMVRDMAQHHDVHFKSIAKYPDYFPNEPGGKPGYRTMEPAVFDLSNLGDEFENLREPYKSTLVMGRMGMTQVEAHTLMSRSPGWIRMTIRMVWRYFTDFAWRKRTWRDRRGKLGQSLIGQLRHAMQKFDLPLWLNTGFESLIQKDGRVVGVRLDKNGKNMNIAASRGVVLACGGFESNQEMREQYLPKPTQALWSVAPGCNHGEGIRAGRDIGAALGFMSLTWGTPSVVVPGMTNAAGLFMERQLPGCIAVDQNGERFVNEALPYTEFVYAMLEARGENGVNGDCWLIFDGTFRKKYPMSPMMPASIQPDKKLPPDWENKVYWKASSLAELADKIGVDAKGLQQSVARMNGFAATGEDEQFGKGDDVFQRYYGDPSVKPNPCLAPVDKAPFYAVRLTPGEIGTKGGLLTDESARVVREDASVIEGLYAVGNCSAAVMGRTYPGPGATLGPAMAFGWLAAKNLADSKKQKMVNAA